MESAKREMDVVQHGGEEAAGRTVQALTRAQPRRPRRHRGLAGPSTPLNGACQEMAVQRRFSLGVGNAPSQGRPARRGGLDALARPAACIAPALFRSPKHGEWVSNKQTGVTVAAALRHGQATPHGGAGDRGIELCKWHVFYHRRTDSLKKHAHRQVSPGKTSKFPARSASGSPPTHCRSSSVATSRWSPSSWRVADGCAPSVALWWRRSSPRSRRRILSSMSSLSPETLQARVKQPRRAPNTSRLTGPSESSCPRG